MSVFLWSSLKSIRNHIWANKEYVSRLVADYVWTGFLGVVHHTSLGSQSTSSIERIHFFLFVLDPQ